jgi:hypothetical protein
MNSKRNIDRRLEELETDENEDGNGGVYIYDSTDADEPACVIGRD